MNLFEFEASLVYKVGSRTARAIQRNPVSTPPQTKKDKITNSKEMDGGSIYSPTMLMSVF